MHQPATGYILNDHLLTEEEKHTFSYLSSRADFYISNLVRNKTHILECRNLYDGIRELENFQFLKESFGVESAIDLTMTPLIKTRIDILIGQLLDDTIEYYITCLDESSLDAEDQQKHKLFLNKVLEAYHKTVEYKDIRAITPENISKIKTVVEEDFISDFVIAASRLLEFFIASEDLFFIQKFKQFALDVLVTGEAYWRTYIDDFKPDPQLAIVKPENIFYNKNTNSQTIDDSVDAVVHREFMTRREVLQKYGHYMDEDTRNYVFGSVAHTAGSNYVMLPLQEEYSLNDFNHANSIYRQFTYNMYEAVEVFHGEFKVENAVELAPELQEDLGTVVDPIHDSREHYTGRRNDKGVQLKPKDVRFYREDTYEFTRIGTMVYLNMGKSKHTRRSQAQRWRSGFSYNGICYNDRNGRPYSLAYKLKDLQDRYDIVTFYRDNLIANSGVDGSRVNTAAIPSELGTEFMERLLKFLALRKQGVELINPTEDGAEAFAHYGDFHASLSANAVQALELVMESIEKQADTLTGVNRYMLGIMEERDAVENVRVGIKQGSLVTKDLLDLIRKGRLMMLSDLIKISKFKYKKGKKLSYIMGNKSYVYTLLPDHYAHTDYNINIVDSDQERTKMKNLVTTIVELTKASTMHPKILLELSSISNVHELMRTARKFIREWEAENNQLQQLNQQVEQLTGQLDQLTKELQKRDSEISKLQNKLTTHSQDRLKLDKYKIDKELDIRERELGLQKVTDNSSIALDRERISLEREELYLATGPKQEIKNDNRK
jgi:hypothetical protein